MYKTNTAGKFLLLAWLTGFAATLQAAPKARLWDHWIQHDPASELRIEHGAWDRWLKRFVDIGVDGINRVAYAGIDTGARAELQAYIEKLQQLPISQYSRAEQKAYWINLYNALTVDVVLQNYPLESIRDISSGLFSSGPWKLKLATVEGEAISLDDIEHRILRPIWQDPRIHYAVNCASLGCPNLQVDAFTAANQEGLLERAAHEFINHPRGARIVDGKLEVSSIYDWFEQDFGGNHAGVIAHLRRYADESLARGLSSIERISDDSYSWEINARR